MEMKRAYSLLEIKSIDEDKRQITGIATTPTPDRYDDIVEPKGAQFKLPLPFLWQHDSHAPIGHVVKAKVSKDGIEVTVELAKVDEPGTLKDRLDNAWQSIKAGLVRGLSIGFRSIESANIDGTWGIRFLKWDWLELSAVTIAANGECSIQTVKSADRRFLAASGHQERGVVRLDSKPGASGSTPADRLTQSRAGVVRAIPPKPQEGEDMNIQDQIKQFKAAREAKVRELDAIMAKSAESGETLDGEQSERYDTLKGEVDTIDKHLKRLEDHEKSVASTAVALPGAGQAATATPAEVAEQGKAARRGDGVIAVAKKLPPGVAFARYAGVLALAKGSVSDAIRIAMNTFPEEKNLHAVLGVHGRIKEDIESGRFTKAAVDIGTTTDSDYAAPLVQYNDMASEFIEFLRPQTIVGKIPGLRRVPFNVRVPRQLTGGSASWVGEAAPKPVTSITLDNVTLKWKKLATIAVISQELARFSSPSAEIMIRDALAAALVQQMDSDFVNPANAGTTDIKPASITNSATPIASGGDTEEQVRRDVRAIFAPFIAANLTPQAGVWIMSATNALSLSLMVNALGQPSFPGITMNGGIFWGMPVIVSEAVGNIVILANANDILLADDGQVTIDSSSEASLQMDSAPTNPVVAATVLISLWQQNLLGIKAERYIDWVKARPQSVQYLSGVEWGLETT